MANSWEIVDTVSDFIFWGFKITEDGDCSHEIKRCLLLGREAMTNLDSVLESWDITFPTKVRIIKAMVFQVFMNRCESWTIKKAEHWRTDVFELWWFSSLLRIPWTARRSNQSIPKEISPEYSGRIGSEAETLVLWSPDAKNWLIGKDPDAGKDWRQEKGLTEDEMIDRHHWFNGHEFEQAPGVGDGQGSLVSCSPWGRKESDTSEQLNWTEIRYSSGCYYYLVFLLSKNIRTIL